MKQTMIAWAIGLCSATAEARDVTSPQERHMTLLEYVASRDDLSKEEHAAWDRTLRLTFGGTAIKDGTDEGVTVAKSVVAAAIFFRIAPQTAAQAAYAAYHDTYRWVPPPIAINYQILAFQGRKPKADPRELAFDFPRYFNEDLAPELVRWWSQQLETGKLDQSERRQIEDVLHRTRDLMRPMLRDRLWQLCELEVHRRSVGAASPSSAADLDRDIGVLRMELSTFFAGVAHDRRVQDPSVDVYERYATLSRELGEEPQPQPSPKVSVPPTPLKPTPPQAPSRPPAGPERGPAPEPFAEVKEAEATRHNESGARGVPAPWPGQPLLPVQPAWVGALDRIVDGWLGTPYRFGGLDRRGIDCSGFTRSVYRQALNVELPRNSRSQAMMGERVEQPRLRPGDLIFFDTLDRGQVTHVAVYLGNGVFAHASSSKGVTRAKLNERYYQRAYWGSRRILDAS